MRGRTAVHIGQVAGTIFIVLGLIALGRSLAHQSGFPGSLGTVGRVDPVLVAAVLIEGGRLLCGVGHQTVPAAVVARQGRESVANHI